MSSNQIKAKVATVAAVVAAIMLISLSAGGGGLEPNAPPGPTMHTLEDIYNAVGSMVEPPPQPFAYDMFLKIEGVPGESQDVRHQDWIEILSYKYGMQESSAGVGPIEHQDFSVTKCLDKATPKLALHCCNQSQILQASLELCRPDTNDPPVYTITLEDVIITSVTPSGGVSVSEILPVEEVTFNYGTIEWEYLANDGNTIFAGWDVDTDTPIDPCGYLNPAD